MGAKLMRRPNKPHLHCLVSTETAIKSGNRNVTQALKRDKPIVNVDWLRACMEEEQLVPLDNYRFDSDALRKKLGIEIDLNKIRTEKEKEHIRKEKQDQIRKEKEEQTVSKEEGYEEYEEYKEEEYTDEEEHEEYDDDEEEDYAFGEEEYDTEDSWTRQQRVQAEIAASLTRQQELEDEIAELDRKLGSTPSVLQVDANTANAGKKW